MCFGPEYIFLFIMLNILIAVITQDFWGKITRYQLFRKYTLYYKDHRCVNFHLPIKYYFQITVKRIFAYFYAQFDYDSSIPHTNIFYYS